jgi:uncharacterized protein YbjT (DUF2867 family)
VLTGPGVYPIPAGNQGIAVVDVRDIAEAAAISLTEEGHTGKTYDLVSSEMLSGPDAAAIWSKLLGKDRCVVFFTRIGGSFTGDFVARHNKTYTLFLFTQPKLHHLASSRFAVHGVNLL